jgi:UDP-glucose 4-epimerase
VSVVLITGVSRYLGARLARELSADPSVSRIVGVDHVQPRKDDRLGRTEFVRADIRNPLIAKVLAQASVDTVVHAPLSGPVVRVGGRPSGSEYHRVGTMQLLAACQKSETVTRLVVQSTTAVYGAGSGDPAVFTEDMRASDQPSGDYARDAVEVESYVRGFVRRRPDITVSILRFASLIGPTIDSPLAQYLSMPIVPTSLGYDPRLQLLHEDDAIEVLRLATLGPAHGIVNVAGAGVVSLSQAIRRTGRIRLPVPAPAIAAVGSVVRNTGVLELSEQASFLNYGRVVETKRLREQFGYQPHYDTEGALRSYIESGVGLPRLASGAVGLAQQLFEATVLEPARRRQFALAGGS